MPDTTIQLTRIQAVEAYNLINVMTGSANYKSLRAQIQEKILKLWPEIKDSQNESKDGETRKLSVSAREQKGFAEGLLGLVTKKDAQGQESITGAEFNFLNGVAKTFKVSKWLATQFDVDSIPDFEGELDDEPPVSDDEQVDTSVSDENVVENKLAD